MVKHNLNKKKLTNLKLSVNPVKGVKNYKRPLNPVQVMEHIQELKDSGLKNDEICELIDIDKTNISNYYTRMKALIPEVQQLVDWGKTESGRMRLGYSSVWHYSRFGEEGQKILYQKALDKDCRRDEIRDMAQLFQRGFGTVEECFDEIIGRRGEDFDSILVIGKILNSKLTQKLENLNQDGRDDLFETVLKKKTIKTDVKFTLSPTKFFLSLDPEQEKDLYSQIISEGFEEYVTTKLMELL